MKEYLWKLESFAKGINPDEAIKELERIENKYGLLIPENIVEASKNKDAILHKLFEWNNTKAAEQYRLQQARNLINNIEVKIISEGQPRIIPVYEIVNVGEGRQYKHIETLTFNEVEQVKNETLRQLNILKYKLSFYDKFDSIIEFIDKAISELN